MNSLKARIALTVMLSIVLVVAATTSATILFVDKPRTLVLSERFSAQVWMIEKLLADGRVKPELLLAATPAPGVGRADMAADLRDQMRRDGLAHEIEVTIPPSSGPVASVRFGDRWLTLPVVDIGGGGDKWLGPMVWALSTIVGFCGLALLVANRILRPLTMLEDIAKNIDTEHFGPDAVEAGPTEVRAMARALNAMKVKLKSAVESRMRLVAAAGHDFRTPLTRMRLRAEFLSEEDRGAWLKDIVELDRIAESAIRLVWEEAGGGQRIRLALDDLLIEIGEDLQAMGLPVTLGPMTHVEIACHRFALTRALRNLMINAATHGGGAVVNLSLLGAQAAIAIEDEGPGIPEAMMPTVFEPFFRAEAARTQSIPGAGLGLAIAREIIDRQGGKLRLSNRPSGGLLQTVTFAIDDSDRDIDPTGLVSAPDALRIAGDTFGSPAVAR